MTAVATAERLLGEARRTNERRVLVLAGDRDRCRAAAASVLDAASIPLSETTLVGPEPFLQCERVPVNRSGDLLGQTRRAVVLDCHDACRPNALGRVTGAVDGGGLLLLLTPPLDAWPERRDGFDETLAVPPFDASDVTGRFRRRLVATLRSHPGVGVVDVNADRVVRDGRTDPAPRLTARAEADPLDAVDLDERRFPAAAYDACLTADQAEALATLERLCEPGTAVVAAADRGRGKSSAAGLAAACLAATGRDVLVTAPRYESAREVFARAAALLPALVGEAAVSGDGDPPRELLVDGGSAGAGRVRFERPAVAADLPGDPDAVIVDEAAALPVHRLTAFLDAPAVAFTTTVRGYEGAGRGFDVRFRERLRESGRAVRDVTLLEPIRYAAGDPVESWVFRALLLDARPPVDQLVADARPGTVTYEALDRDDLVADENRLRETFGLLVAAHYRTEPDDLARLLDAPNVSIRALSQDGHPVCVALLAREGGLPESWRRRMYEGDRIRGNMLPDVLTSQLRDERAGQPVGQRILRIATHHAARSRGLGSRLLDEIRAEFAGADWLGTGYGATERLVAFWRDNGFSTVHVSTTRNAESGEHSALMLDPRSEAGRRLHDRHAAWFADRIGAVLADALDDLDPDVARACLRACDVDASDDLALTDRDWRLVAGAGHGPAMYAVDPRPFRRLAVAHLVDPVDPGLLTPRQERLLVRKVLQARPAASVADELGHHSTGQCMRAVGETYRLLADAYGGEVARDEADRYRD